MNPYTYQRRYREWRRIADQLLAYLRRWVRAREITMLRRWLDIETQWQEPHRSGQ